MAASRKTTGTDAIVKELRAFGLRYPGAHIKSPWPDHADLAVNDKTFAYLSIEGRPFGISCKLPQSSDAALMLPFAKPAGYGLGKSGWVQAEFGPGDVPPVELLKKWIDESYRAQAPKKLVKQLDAERAGGSEAEPETAPAAKKKAPSKNAPAKKRAAPAAKRATKKAAEPTKPPRAVQRQKSRLTVATMLDEDRGA